MSTLKRFLTGSILFLWVALPLVAQDLENPNYLKQGAWGLAKQNKPQSLFLFLEGQFPTFTATAQKAGLVQLLDGNRNWSSFEADWSSVCLVVANPWSYSFRFHLDPKWE